jgi:hypothetical protein
LPELKKKHQDINVLVLLNEMEFEDLEKASSISKWWGKTANALPIFLSEREWRQSADIFTLEYADIRDNHHVAYGEDLFSQVEVDMSGLRMICELELHKKLIALRQRLMIHRDNPKTLIELLHKSVNSFSAIFRGVLRLKIPREQVPQKAHQVFEKMQDIVEDYSATPFLRVLQSMEPTMALRNSDVFVLFSDYLRQLERVRLYVDQYQEIKLS